VIILNHEQNTSEWLAARLGKPTASMASSIITSKGERSSSLTKYAEYLAGCEIAQIDINAWEGNKHTDRGHEMEIEARNAYIFETGISVNEVGFCLTDDGRIGASPDGLCGDKGGLEIKCFSRNHVNSLLYYAKHKKPPPSRTPQIQMQMLVCELDWVDLFLYHPDLPTKIIRVERDDLIQTALILNINDLLDKKAEYVELLKEI